LGTSAIRSEITRRPGNLRRIEKYRADPRWCRYQAADRPAARNPPTWLLDDLQKSNMGRTKYDESALEMIIQAILRGASVEDACGIRSFLHVLLLIRRIKSDEALGGRYRALVESAPYSVQANCHKLGENFGREVVQRHGAGVSLTDIAHALQVSVRSVAKAISYSRRR
jgi:hypothetical protein